MDGEGGMEGRRRKKGWRGRNGGKEEKKGWRGRNGGEEEKKEWKGGGDEGMEGRARDGEW